MAKNIYFNLSSINLVALMCSRICHDIISPIGAIHNSLELLDEVGVEDEAMQLIRLSSMNAIIRLKFIRLAFGYSGSVHSSVCLEDIKQIIKEFVSIDKRVQVFWKSDVIDISREKSKLLLNIFMVAYASIPRGGVVTISINNSKTDNIFSLKINGKSVRLPEKFIQIINGNEDIQIDSHDVQFYYAVLLANDNKMKILYENIDHRNVSLSLLEKYK
ncbi:histidine phosphotransferase family protein [Candidatus Liberibacter brunswickensis]|uniref:histidine phosphotransferase family protein n=1 Tax=Candidatus Liberibacter brunswickensis TaxID=1968796 RepID=UPI002FE00A6E